MQNKVFAIRDTKAEAFHQPFFTKTVSEAERSFHQLVNDPQSLVAKYPEDYDLYMIGSYDTNTGGLTTLDTPQHIAKAISLKTLQS